jgi:hypothetical protein
VVELIDGGYRLTAQELMPLEPTALLGWLCQPELMQRWIPALSTSKSLTETHVPRVV